MKVAVSGSNGFVGSRVCKILRTNGIEVYPIDITNGLDLSEPGIFDMIPRVDHFIHLANLVFVPMSYEEPYKFYRINYMTTLNALEYCRKSGAHLIYSSSYIYGTPQYLPVDEYHPVNAFNPYAETKVICERLCEGYYKYFGVKSSILRPFNLYGEGQKGKLLIPEIFSQIKEGGEIQLKSSTPRRDFINIEDAARAFVACLNDKTPYSIYNICSGRSVSIKELTDIIKNEAFNFGAKLHFTFSETERVNEVNETVGTYMKIYQSLGWKPIITLEEGIRRMLHFEFRDSNR